MNSISTPINLTTAFYEVVIEGAVILTPFATSKGHAVELALALYKSQEGIPTSVTIRHDSVTRIPLVIGTTVPSKSNAAIVRGRKVSA